ncbi:MAG TPA: right-handed parallel beta-helix repeat-containing protein [Thermoanaerobaculia bacterium]|nr:right-handed parallel beta-helix repeat-containing protein [Thermoanaerobaculia bacterium]
MKRNFVLSALALASALLASAVPAHAQATRTWVSGVGDDANPCSRTAPCKTFAGAISKTAPGGEINVLDPGGFGAVTITKPITISSEGFEAGVLVSGTNGIVVSVPNAGDVVILRGLDIEGLGTGLSGVTVLTGGTVQIDKCYINKFTVSGINFAPTVAGSQLHVIDSVIRNNGTAPSSGQGILANPSGAAKLTLDNVRLEDNIAGLKLQGAVVGTVRNSIATSNGFAGFSAFSGGATLNIEHSVATHNGTGVNCAAGTTVRMGNTMLTNNATDFAAGGTCQSFKNNDVGTAGITVTPVTTQ